MDSLSLFTDESIGVRNAIYFRDVKKSQLIRSIECIPELGLRPALFSIGLQLLGGGRQAPNINANAVDAISIIFFNILCTGTSSVFALYMRAMNSSNYSPEKNTKYKQLMSSMINCK